MKFMVCWKISPGFHKPAAEEFLKFGAPLPDGVTLHGRWHAPGSHQGWLVIETDGYRAHGQERRFESDRDRDQRLGSAGWRVYRFTPKHVFDHPQRTVNRIATLLHPAARQR